MKTFTLALVFLAAVAIDVAYAKSCKSNDDCDEKQCCAGFTPFRGTCKAMTKENRKCLLDDPIFPFNEIHIVTCPCEEGLECQEVEGKKGKGKDDGVCKKPATEEPETTTADGSSETTSSEGSSETTGPDGSSETTGDQSGETGTQGQSGETTQDQGSSGETTQDDTTSGEVQTDAPEE